MLRKVIYQVWVKPEPIDPTKPATPEIKKDLHLGQSVVTRANNIKPGTGCYADESGYFHAWGTETVSGPDDNVVAGTVAIIENCKSGYISRVNPERVRFVLPPEDATKHDWREDVKRMHDRVWPAPITHKSAVIKAHMQYLHDTEETLRNLRVRLPTLTEEQCTALFAGISVDNNNFFTGGTIGEKAEDRPDRPKKPFAQELHEYQMFKKEKEGESKVFEEMGRGFVNKADAPPVTDG